MDLFIYNTLTRKKDIFTPLEKGEVSMYVCGMTVYDAAHLGHARAYTAFDVIARLLAHLGYRVRYVRNITDIDDKIIRRAREDDPAYPTDPRAACARLAEKYTEAFHADMEALGLLPPTLEPRATDHIDAMIEIIERLISDGKAYASGGNVYFDVSRFDAYGALSGRNVEDLHAQSRLERDPDKRSPLDFALWKSHVEGEPCWDSPFGKGRPGWHIECSAMSMKYLGEEFDIHGGGRDLIFPHHENEICQSCAFSGKRFARYWVHNGFITVNQEKMSKSLKNFKTVRELMKRYPPMHLKFYLLSTHYRSPLDFSDELIRGSAEGLKKIQNALERADKILAGRSPFPSRSGKIRPPDEFLKALCDDFNTPRALACLFSFLSEWNRELASETVSPEAVAERYRVMLSMLEILGIRPEIRNVNEVSRDQWTDPGEEALAILDRPDTDPSPEEIRLLVAARGAGKLKKDFARADRIRNFLQSKGIELRDSANATTWKRAEKSN